MKSSLLMEKMNQIQIEYKILLQKLLPKLKSEFSVQALDDINLFWYRHMDIVRLYLASEFAGAESYVFTAATYLDYDNNEHLPFLLLGEQHVLDDPLSKYSAICKDLTDAKAAHKLYEQIEKTAEDNIKIIENCQGSIFVVPLRLFNQYASTKEFFELGERTFASLFIDIEGLKDFFSKCNTLDDILSHARSDIEDLVRFSESDDRNMDFKTRFAEALKENDYMIDDSKSDAYNFFMLVYGCIQQAIDVIISCLEYNCIPFIRYPVALHYISLLTENLKATEHIDTIRYKMSIAFVLHNLIDKERLSKLKTKDFITFKEEYDFNEKLFECFEANGINQDTFLRHEVGSLMIDTLESFYLWLESK